MDIIGGSEEVKTDHYAGTENLVGSNTIHMDCSTTYLTNVWLQRSRVVSHSRGRNNRRDRIEEYGRHTDELRHFG